MICKLVYRENGKVIWEMTKHNIVMHEGFQRMYLVSFQQSTNNYNWYFRAIAESGYTGVAITDILSSHPGWLDYAGATPAQWTPIPTPVDMIMESTIKVTMSFTAAGQIRGLYVSSNNGAYVDLWSTVVFDTPRSVSIGGTLSILYTITGEL